MIRRRANPPHVLRCDFCKRLSTEVRVLITTEKGDRAICDQCAEIAHKGAQQYIRKGAA